MSIDNQTLKALRKKLGFKQSEMSDLFNVTQVAYGRWENGLINIPKAAIDKIHDLAKTDSRWDISLLEERYFEVEKEKSRSINEAMVEELRATIEHQRALIDSVQKEKAWLMSLFDRQTAQLAKLKALSNKRGIVIKLNPNKEAA